MTSVPMPPIGSQTIRQLMDADTVAAPDCILCTFRGDSLRFGELDARANRIANALLARGLVPGDRVALMLRGHPDHIACIFAQARVSLVRVPVTMPLIGASLDFPFDAFAVDALIADAA